MVSVDRRGLGINQTLGIKAPCRVATTANITLNGLQTIDSVPLAEGDRVLVWQQTDGRQNGPYNASSGNWTRALDADGNDEWIRGFLVQVNQGTLFGTVMFRNTTPDPVTLDTTVITFTGAFLAFSGIGSINNAVPRFSGTAGALLKGSGVLIDDAN